MRDLTAAFQTELDAQVKVPIILFEGEFEGGTLNLWTGIGELSWDGKIWTGAGHLGTVSPIKETQETKAVGMRATLNGVSQELIALALVHARRGKAGRVWLGFLDSNYNVIANPYKSFEGRLDQPEIDMQVDDPSISINYESRLIDLERPRERRHTDEDQKADFPDDEGFEYVPRVQDWDEKWGQK